MTAVVGILNRKGVALAADSAVTRTLHGTSKCSMNGNKMVRLCTKTPVMVMFTGNSMFLGTPWDIIARKYRTERGDRVFPTVLAAAEDFFEFLAQSEEFWTDRCVDNHIVSSLNALVEKTFRVVDCYDGDGFNPCRYMGDDILDPEEFVKIMRVKFGEVKAELIRAGKCPQFDGFGLEKLKEWSDRCIKRWTAVNIGLYSQEILDELRPDFESALLAQISCRNNDFISPERSRIIFSGFGEEQEYPSIVSVPVYGGVDGRVNYHISAEDIVCIDDEHPSAICPFAQRDVIDSVIYGVDEKWRETVENFILDENGQNPNGRTVATSGIHDALEANLNEWKSALVTYDLRSMAELAECLIDLTGFHRILTFMQEGVGGPVDLAVISKTDGIKWLSRKSWYLRHSANRYGNFGI